VESSSCHPSSHLFLTGFVEKITHFDIVVVFVPELQNAGVWVDYTETYFKAWETRARDNCSFDGQENR
jgi:hypothetical protein